MFTYSTYTHHHFLHFSQKYWISNLWWCQRGQTRFIDCEYLQVQWRLSGTIMTARLKLHVHYMVQNLRPSFFLSSSVVRLRSLLPCEVPTRTRPPSCRPMLKLELCSTGKWMGRHVILFSVWGFRLALWCFDSAACSALLFFNPSFLRWDDITLRKLWKL